VSDQQLRQALRLLPGWSDVEVKALIEGCRALLRARAQERRDAERERRAAQAETTAQRVRRVMDGMATRPPELLRARSRLAAASDAAAVAEFFDMLSPTSLGGGS
jgi:hypothetical protein